MNEIIADLILLLGPVTVGGIGFLIMIKWPEGKTIPSGAEYRILDDIVGESSS